MLSIRIHATANGLSLFSQFLILKPMLFYYLSLCLQPAGSRPHSFSRPTPRHTPYIYIYIYICDSVAKSPGLRRGLRREYTSDFAQKPTRRPTPYIYMLFQQCRRDRSIFHGSPFNAGISLCNLYSKHVPRCHLSMKWNMY